ncbi:MAG: FtsX-like permease family protein [candidate division Zixibacteria bacterium]|nr:FtsX-like permease family protein [candidate division Zixibacteria bacterium]
MNYLIKELYRHLWRTIAGISGYIIAALFILLVLSVTRTNEKDSFGILKGTGTHFIAYIPSNASCCVSCTGESANGSLFAEGVYTMMLNKDIIKSIKEIKGVKDATPYLLYKLYDEKYKAEISLGGIDTGSIATKNNVCAATNLIEGKFLSDKQNEIVAEESFAVAHSLSVGDTLYIYGGKMILAGIINSGIKPGKADIYAPIEDVRSILKYKLKCISPGFDMNIVLVEVEDARIQKSVIDQLKKEKGYLSVSSYNCYEPASEVMTIIEGTSTVLSILIFIFLIIFSAKTQLTSLMERSREIGILKSLGWSNSKLSSQILFNSLIQSLTGVSVGILLGVLIILLMNIYQIRLFNLMEFNFQFNSIPVLIILSLIGGIIASLFPIIKLYRTKAGDMINNYL